jgi:hypothetical protein
MLKPLKTFFYPKTVIYTYNESEQVVLKKIVDALERKVTLFGSNDTTGRLVDFDTFVLEMWPGGFNSSAKFTSTLVGQVVQLQNGMTEVRTKTKASIGLYVLFFTTIFFGLSFLFVLLQMGARNMLVGPFAILLIGPSLCVGFSHVANTAIQDRYRLYIDKELKALNVG